jgi:1-phosphofructokinase family hexose kinase
LTGNSLFLTVTPNPTLDRILHVPTLTAGLVHRATSVQLVAGGKGLNVARAARNLGGEVLATAPLAGHSGRLLADLLVKEGLPTNWHWLESGETRTCLLMTHDTGDATVINEPGDPIPNQAWADFAGHVERLAGQAQVVTFCGSMPPGVEPAALNRLAGSLVTADRTVYLDTSGAALAAALAGRLGLVIKVNRAELAAELDHPVENFSIPYIIAVGQSLLARGAALVVVTLGSEGALAIAKEGAWHASMPPVQGVSAVGSGDSFLAGLVVAGLRGQNVAEALAYGVACGAANASTSLPGRFEREMVGTMLARVEVKRKT